MDLRFKGPILKFDVVDKCNRKFAPDCEIAFPEKIPVTYFFGSDEVLGYADISKTKDGLDCDVLPFGTDVLPKNEYSVGGYYTQVKFHKEGAITVIDSARLTSMSIVPENNVADENLKIRRVKN